MGRFKQQMIEAMEDKRLTELHFDDMMPAIEDDNDWWRQQDTELQAEELAQIESDAEIQEYRLEGYA